jgi:hypothetical protein
MRTLYTEEEFKAAKSRQLLPLRCIGCTKTFHRTKHKIQEVLSEKTRRTLDFCSSACKSERQKRSKTVICDQCGKPLTKTRSQIATTKHNFCCKSCAGKWHNAHKKHGTRCSKLEIWLQTQLIIIYPNLEFHFNRTDAINGELDIFIPSLRLAFELNGIFHYEPIYGPEKLAKIQNNDTRKSQACFERGIELCIIDNSSMKNFKPLKALKFLQIIQDIIKIKLLGSHHS